MRESLSQMMADTTPAPSPKPKLIANNTVKYTHADGTVRIRLHKTDIVTQHPDGTFTLNSGGWRTVTTKARIDQFAPVNLGASGGEWWVHNNNADAVIGLRSSVPFFDGMRVDHKGLPLDPPKADRVAEFAKLRKQVNKFVRLCDTVDTLPVPGPGDCWLCMAEQTEAGTQGGFFGTASGTAKVTGDTSHLMSHIEEGYLHGTLLVNAMRAAGFENAQIRAHYSMNIRDTFKRKLRNYLLRAFGMAI